MFTREITILKQGFHAGSAAALLRIAKNFPEPIFLAKLSGEAVPISSQLRLLSLNIKPAETIVIAVKTPDAQLAQTVFDAVIAVIAEHAAG